MLLEFLNCKKPKRKLDILLIFACQALGELLYKIKTRVVISGVLTSAFCLWDRWGPFKKNLFKGVTDCMLTWWNPILFLHPLPFPSRDGARSWGLDDAMKVEPSWMRSVPFTVRREVAALCFLLCEDTRYQQSVTWKKVLPWPCWHPDLKLQVSRTVGSKFLLLISHLVYGNLL